MTLATTPTIPLPPVPLEPVSPAEASEKVTLLLDVPYDVFDITLTLTGFNHKPQDTPDESYEWIDFTAATKSNRGETLSLHGTTTPDETGKSQTLFTQATFDQYRFKLRSITYGVSAEIEVERIQ